MKILYGSLFRTIKRMKRDVENNMKYEKTDIQAYMEKIKSEGKSFVALNLNIGKIKKIREFGKNKFIYFHFHFSLYLYFVLKFMALRF